MRSSIPPQRRCNVQNQGRQVKPYGSRKVALLTFFDRNRLCDIMKTTFIITLHHSTEWRGKKKEGGIITPGREKELKKAMAEGGGGAPLPPPLFTPKEDFVPQLMLAKGLAAFHLQRFDETVRELEMLIEEHPASELVPQAEYYMGAASFKLTGETNRLSEACRELIMTHPESPWTKRCSIWGRSSNYFRPFVGYDGGGSAGSGAY